MGGFCRSLGGAVDSDVAELDSDCWDSDSDHRDDAEEEEEEIAETADQRQLELGDWLGQLDALTKVRPLTARTFIH